MKKTTLRISRFILTAAAMACAGTVSAQVVLGAGATLPQSLYNDIFSSNGIDGVVGAWDYEGGGSGEGKRRFLDKFSSDTVSFAGSDSVLKMVEFADYNQKNLGTWGPLIQLPALITPIVLGYTKLNLPELSLARAQVCDIFAGRVQTWGQILGNGDPQLIRVAYRSDRSGSTEILSKFLSDTCSGDGFLISDSFAAMVGGAMANGIPNHWQGVASEEDMSAAASANGSFGYLGPAYGFPPDDPAKVAKVDGFLPSTLNLLGISTPPVGTAAQDPMNWIPSFSSSTPGTGYPIYGTTNLLVAQCYDGGFGVGSKGLAIRSFLARLYSGARPYAQKISSHHFVELPNLWKVAIQQTFLPPSSNGLAIGNSAVCSSVGHP